ncbi:MAG TPA: GNAT family N-acetyltransferase [Hyphomicrobiaceae bacterium]|nr:GNAT family N-acetyltransferase [Hyphomicrobiaceae bacterium]
MLNIDVIRPTELSDQQAAAWREIQDQNSLLSSPFFSPEFACAVAQARDDAFVGIIRRNSDILAFFPFQRRGRGALPIGAAICDYQGLIGREINSFSARELLEGCHLNVVDFNHVPAAQKLFRDHSTTISHSPYIDLSAGYSKYIERRKAQGVSEVATTLRKQRKLEREVGAIRFVPDDDSDVAWQNLIAWKNAQYRSTNVVEVLSRPWVVGTLAAIRKMKTAQFSGMLSSLYAGDELLAVHFGMRSSSVWHYWFPAYNADYNRYSPGLLLLLRMAEHGASMGLRMIDLGRGRARYKNAFADAEIELCEGSIERPLSPSGVLRVTRKMVERSWGALPVGSARNWPRRVFNRLLWRV